MKLLILFFSFFCINNAFAANYMCTWDKEIEPNNFKTGGINIKITNKNIVSFNILSCTASSSKEYCSDFNSKYGKYLRKGDTHFFVSKQTGYSSSIQIDYVASNKVKLLLNISDEYIAFSQPFPKVVTITKGERCEIDVPL